jgi:hypothetical protein
LGEGGLYRQIYDLQLKDQEQFVREMMFLDGSEVAEEEQGEGRGARMRSADVRMANAG